ncbi:MAG: Abi family protein [Nitrospinae bacterium]|nr:Abi family protein [Nitrospinota bacterium]MBF0633756.1 Abi family protein [Nitrospinota bacterium]
MKYSKPPLSIDEQIDLLMRRGLHVPDRPKAYRYLTHINYYRLRIYWFTLEMPSGEEDDHRFAEGSTFDDVVELYVLDRKLRLLVLEAVERFEVSFRSMLVNHLAAKHGSHAYLNQTIFKKPETYSKCVEQLKANLGESKETFIEHYRNKYTEPAFPPIWSAFEILSFGDLAKWYQVIRQRSDRQAISKTYNLDEKALNSFVHHLNHVRNISAHHGRLWNRHLTITMKIPDHPNDISGCFNRHEDAKYRIYNTLTMLAYLLKIISPSTTWPQRVKTFIGDFKRVNPSDMGFPDKWESLPIWSDVS